jgi:hypothetical protein
MAVEIIVPVVAMIAVFGSISFIAYLFFSARHKERMALLEYNKDATVFSPQKVSRFGALKFGLVLVMGGVGLLVAYFFSEVFRMPEELAVFSMLLIGGGGGLLVYYYLAGKAISREEAVERFHEETTV